MNKISMITERKIDGFDASGNRAEWEIKALKKKGFFDIELIDEFDKTKIPKIIEIFSKRLQVQENLTNQISSALDSIISPHGLGVVVEARHTCSIMRGDNFSSSNLITSSMHGSFRSNSKTRQEFLSHIEKNVL